LRTAFERSGRGKRMIERIFRRSWLKAFLTIRERNIWSRGTACMVRKSFSLRRNRRSYVFCFPTNCRLNFTWISH
jgi:hypothetical protein